MACIVLVSSTGFGLVEHSCMIRGKKLYLAAQEKKSGCPSCRKAHARADGKSNAVTIQKKDCCQEQTQFRNIDVASSFSQLVAKLLKSLTDLAVQGISLAVQWLVGLLFPLKDELVRLFSSPPTSLSGRDLLAFVQRFLL